VNIGADRADDLYFFDFESSPEPEQRSFADITIVDVGHGNCVTT
jgi:hypothetical protein